MGALTRAVEEIFGKLDTVQNEPAVSERTVVAKHPMRKTTPKADRTVVYSPSDHIAEYQIEIDSDSVVINIENAFLSRFSASGSMLPTFHSRANGIEIRPESEEDIKPGDIIAFSNDSQSICHRVLQVGEDDEGWYAITKGDNNPEPDQDKVRFDDIEGVLVGLLF